jgi:hypothetical protein
MYSDNVTQTFSGGIVRECLDDPSTGANLGKKSQLHLPSFCTPSN